MIVEFSVGNYRSFLKPQTFSFRATTLESLNSDVESRNVDFTDGTRMLKIAGIYGPNGSGKSNVLKALGLFRDLVSRSLISEGLIAKRFDPFKTGTKELAQPTYFQIVILIDAKRYRYGFQVDEAGVESEWLFGPAQQNETFYFKRKRQSLEFNTRFFPEADNLPMEKLRADALFLPFCSSYEGPIAGALRDQIRNHIFLDQSVNSIGIIGRHNRLTNDLVVKGQKKMVLDWLRAAGLNFVDIHIQTREIEDSEISEVFLVKESYDGEGQLTGLVSMNLNRDESAGTRKFYAYIGMLHFVFETGGLYAVDEIDNNFHPFLLKKLIALFQDSSINKGRAQLLFTSHDTNIMHPECMRRDQFYFTEKTLLDHTQLYSMADLKGIRNNADFARQYLSGFYGALPVLGSFIEEEAKED